MRKTLMVVGAVAVVAAATFVVGPMLTQTRTADAAMDWLKDFDAAAKEFTGEIVITTENEDGARHVQKVPLEGPRRMAYYTPRASDNNNVFAGAIYALHINGNPEIIIAIESAGDEDESFTYIEVSRLSGAAMNVYRDGETVAEFPRASGVDGAYVGMTR